MTQPSPDKNDNKKEGDFSESDEQLLLRHRRLSQRLADIGREEELVARGEGRKVERDGAFSKAMRIGSDFIAAVVVGALMGYGLDHLMGTMPLFLASFLVLGFAAGVMTVLRAEKSNRQEIKAPSGAADKTKASPGDDEER